MGVPLHRRSYPYRISKWPGDEWRRLAESHPGTRGARRGMEVFGLCPGHPWVSFRGARAEQFGLSRGAGPQGEGQEAEGGEALALGDLLFRGIARPAYESQDPPSLDRTLCALEEGPGSVVKCSDVCSPCPVWSPPACITPGRVPRLSLQS